MYKIFSRDNRKSIESNIIKLLNDVELMSASTLNSPRAVGDAVQSFLEHNFSKAVPSGLIKDFNSSFARRAMADFAFNDIDGNYFIIDNKTHNINTNFNMPNLTSVERLSRFYEDSKNVFSILLISYKVDEERLIFTDCIFVPIEMLDWSCLTLGALGWGQIQIANSNKVVVNESNSRKRWMLQLCDALDIFYPNEISKIQNRINHFSKIRNFWEEMPE